MTGLSMVKFNEIGHTQKSVNGPVWEHSKQQMALGGIFCTLRINSKRNQNFWRIKVKTFWQLPLFRFLRLSDIRQVPCWCWCCCGCERGWWSHWCHRWLLWGVAWCSRREVAWTQTWRPSTEATSTRWVEKILLSANTLVVFLEKYFSRVLI